MSYRMGSRGLAAGLALSVFAGAAAAQSMDAAERLEDREQIEATLARYLLGLDRLDAEIYASAFTPDGGIVIYDEDAHFGRQELTAYIDGVVETMDAAAARGEGMLMFHMHYNTRIAFTGPDTAEHTAYWTTTARFPDESIEDIGVGTLKDTLVQQPDGSWLMQRRELYHDPF